MEDEHKKLMLAVWTGYVLLTSSNLEIFHHYFSSFAFRGNSNLFLIKILRNFLLSSYLRLDSDVYAFYLPSNFPRNSYANISAPFLFISCFGEPSLHFLFLCKCFCRLAIFLVV